MFDEWNRSSEKGNTYSVPSAQRSDGNDIRRNYNRMIQNQKKRITQENKDFFSPEYLQQEKFYVLHEISKLKLEIKPLTIQYQKLLAEKEKLLPTPKDSAPEKTELYSDITEEQKNRQQLEDELARERRHFSEGTRFRLQYELQMDHQQIHSILEQIEQEKAMINEKKKHLDAITNSQLANTIREQDSEIDRLQSDLRELQQEEKQLKERAIEFIKDSAYSATDAREVNSMKKKLEILNTIQLRKSSEYRKRRNELEKEKQNLQAQIDAKKKKKHEMQQKENWRKNLKIKEIVVTEEDYEPYQPRTQVYRAMPQPQGLPPLNRSSSSRKTPKAKQSQSYQPYEPELPEKQNSFHYSDDQQQECEQEEQNQPHYNVDQEQDMSINILHEGLEQSQNGQEEDHYDASKTDDLNHQNDASSNKLPVQDDAFDETPQEQPDPIQVQDDNPMDINIIRNALAKY